MKKLYIIAALLMATTSAHAGGGISFEINGERVRVEAPRNCNALSCIKITAPGYSGTVGSIDLKGIGSKHKDDDDFADTAPAKSAPAPAPAPVQAAAPQPAAPAATYVAPAPARRRGLRRAGSADVAAPVPARSPPRCSRSRPRCRNPVSDPNSPPASGRPKGGATCASSRAARTSAAMPSRGEKILISMKPEGGKWTGRIHDPDSGRTMTRRWR